MAKQAIKQAPAKQVEVKIAPKLDKTLDNYDVRIRAELMLELRTGIGFNQLCEKFNLTREELIALARKFSDLKDKLNEKYAKLELFANKVEREEFKPAKEPKIEE